jgi:hypothetical protein
MAKGFIFFCLLVSLQSGFGQGFSPPMTIRTPYGNVTTPGTYRPPLYYGNGQVQTVFKRAKLMVQLKSDSTFTVQAKFDSRADSSTITIKDKKGGVNKVIRPTDTNGITRIFQPGIAEMPGIPADSCWLFKVISGKINCYSNVPMESEASIIAIQEGKGAIVKLTKDNLLMMMPERNEKLEKLIKKEKWIEAIRIFNNPPSR